jgi:perosamine synthetase
LIPVNRPLIEKTDVLQVAQALNSGWVSGEGPIVDQMEIALAKSIRVQHCVAVSSGTAAIDVVMSALEVGTGDQVIAPATTIISTVSEAAKRGAKLEIVDVDPDSWCMSVPQTLDAFTEKTKVVVPVHLFGLAVDLDPIVAKAKANEVFLLEDAAEALGLDYKGQPCGSIGDAGVFSFYANKIVTGGEGGAISSNSDYWSSRFRSFRNLCFDPHERFVHSELGTNSRMPSMTAALVASQLQRLPELVAKKRAIGKRYLEGLTGHPWIQLPLSETPTSQNVFWVFGFKLLEDAPCDAPKLADRLRSHGVDTRRFFFPLHLQPALINIGAVDNRPRPVAESLWHTGLYLPSGLGNSWDEIDQSIEALWKAAK